MAKTIEVSHLHAYRHKADSETAALIKQLANSSLRLNNQIAEMTESLKALISLFKSESTEEKTEIKEEGADITGISDKLDKLLEQNYKILQSMNDLAGAIKRIMPPSYPR